MDQEIFNLSIRKFLKTVGVSSQREIEQAVAKAIAAGTIGGAETLAATHAALERGAEVIAVTAGEPLGGLVESAGGQVVRVPAGLPPRAALGSLLLHKFSPRETASPPASSARRSPATTTETILAASFPAARSEKRRSRVGR